MYPGPDARACQDLTRPPLNLAALEEPLSDPLIEVLCAEVGHHWRRRTFTPGLTVRSIVYRGLYPDKSIDAVLADIAAAEPQCDGPTDSAWCQARDRLPEAVLGRLLEHAAQDVLDRCGGRFHVAGRPVYHDRWTIETRINSLKTVLAARVLRSQSVAAIRKELLGRMLAYNLVWAVIHQTARRHRVAAARLSFAGAVRTILAFSVALVGLRGPARAEVYDRMLAHVARHRNPYRPEPRLIKRQPTKYPPLQQPRAIARLQA